jgi:hypothetical protein
MTNSLLAVLKFAFLIDFKCVFKALHLTYPTEFRSKTFGSLNLKADLEKTHLFKNQFFELQSHLSSILESEDLLH